MNDLVDWYGTVATPNGDVRVVVCVRPEKKAETPIVDSVLKAFGHQG
jgi:hypothetical protein